MGTVAPVLLPLHLASHSVNNILGHRSHKLVNQRQLVVKARLRKAIKPLDHMRQQIQLPVEERFHVQMAMGMQYLVRRDTALVFAVVELKHRSDIFGNVVRTVVQKFKSMILAMCGVEA